MKDLSSLATEHPSATVQNLATSPTGNIDMVDYMVMDSSFNQVPKDQYYAFTGTQTKFGPDPDRAGTKTFILTKFGNSDAFEVYKYTDTEIHLRNENIIYRPNNGVSKDLAFVRILEARGRPGSGSGGVWSTRFIDPSKPNGIATETAIDRFYHNGTTYQFDPQYSTANLGNWISVSWATLN